MLKIEQLEKTEADASALISSLREENTRLGAQIDTATSTISSQSSLILGLRTTLHKLNVRGVKKTQSTTLFLTVLLVPARGASV